MNASTRPVVVVGAGSVGSFFGAMLARAGHPVVLVGRPAHVEAIRRDGLKLHMGGELHRVAIAATTELEAVRDAEWVLFCVKSRDTQELARRMAPLLAPDALVLSLQNGVENPAVLARHLRQPVIAAAVYVATALPEPGAVRHFGRGELVIGPADAAAARAPGLAQRLQELVDRFASAQVPVTVSDRVLDELWGKLLVNCAYNAISALTRQPYGRMVGLASIRALQDAVVREVLEVAHACGHPLDETRARASVEQIGRSMPGQLSSTAQDLAAGKPTEIDDLNGLIVRRGAELGIATPANQALYALVRLAQGEQDGADGISAPPVR